MPGADRLNPDYASIDAYTYRHGIVFRCGTACVHAASDYLDATNRPSTRTVQRASPPSQPVHFRLLLGSRPPTESALEEAVPYLQDAAQCYCTLEMYSAQCDVLFLLSVVLHNAGQLERRDEIARDHAEAMKMREMVHTVVIEPWIEDTWAIVEGVGAALASR